MIAARKARQIAVNVANVLSIEIIAAQGIDSWLRLSRARAL